MQGKVLTLPSEIITEEKAKCEYFKKKELCQTTQKMNFLNRSNLMETVDIFKSKGGRFCYSYFYARIISKRRKSRDIPGTSAN